MKRKHWLGLFVTLSLSTLGIFATQFIGSDLRELSLFRRLPGEHLVALLLLILGLWLVEGWRVQVILGVVGKRLGFIRVVKINLAANFMAAITPCGAGGPPLQAYLLVRQGIPLDKSLVVVVIRHLLTLFFFGISIPVVILVFRHKLKLGAGLDWVLLAAAIIMMALVTIFFMGVSRPELLRKLVFRALGFKPFRGTGFKREKVAQRVYVEANRFHRSLQLLKESHNRLRIFWLLGHTIIYWFLFFSIIPVILDGINVASPTVLTLARQIIVYFLTAYVPIPGGSGFAEFGLASLFINIVPRELLGGFVASWRLATYYSSILFGGITLFSLNRGATTRKH